VLARVDPGIRAEDSRGFEGTRSFLLSRARSYSETHRANLEGSPVRHVHPAGILRASCRSRRFSLDASACQSLSQLGLDREESHLPFGAREPGLRRRIGPLDDHYRAEGIAPRTRRGRSLGSRAAMIDAGRAAATPRGIPADILNDILSSLPLSLLPALTLDSRTLLSESREWRVELIDRFIGGWSRGRALPRNPRASSKATTRYRLGAAFNRPSLTRYLDPRPRAPASFLRPVSLGGLPAIGDRLRDCFYCLDYRRRANALTGGRGSPRSSRRVNYF